MAAVTVTDRAPCPRGAATAYGDPTRAFAVAGGDAAAVVVVVDATALDTTPS